MPTTYDTIATNDMRGAIAREILSMPRERIEALIGRAASRIDFSSFGADETMPMIEIDVERGVFAVEGHADDLGAFVAGAVSERGFRFTNGGCAAYDTVCDYYAIADRFLDEAFAAANAAAEAA